MKEKLIVIGNGMAGIRTLEEVLKREPDKYKIAVFGREAYTNYNRILLSSLLSGDSEVEDIILNDNRWYLENEIVLFTDNSVVAIDTNKQQVCDSKGKLHSYDRLIIATGSNPFIPPMACSDLAGVVSFRTIEDVETMLLAAKTKKKAVVIGGGLLGLEAAEGLLKQGMDVTVVHLLEYLMEMQLDRVSANFLKMDLQERGIKFEMNARTDSILGDANVTGIKLVDGRELAADLVVISVGIRPAMSLALEAGIHCDRGIVVDDRLQTSANNVYAVGECIQYKDQVFGLLAPVYEQAKVLAKNLIGDDSAKYLGSEVSCKLKVNGVDLFSSGDLFANANAGADEIVVSDPISRTYKKLIIQERKIIGIILYGDVRDSSWLFQLFKEQTDVSSLYEQLLLGQGHGEGAGISELDRVAVMSDSTEVCGCNGISKGQIVEAITGQGCETLEAIQAQTTAAASCGSCSNLVEQILSSTLGACYDTQANKKPMCGCTSLTHEELRAAIVEQALKSIPQIISALNWQTADGCHHCRPALNFYLLVAWPSEYQDDPRSRHISERVHANIQKDGSYAVIPRIWGGLTSANELRQMGEIAEKYQTAVKITGGQRIALAGVRKEDLPLIWKDLNDAGFISGHAYGKALRSVKTCVGDLLCSYGIRDSIPLGIEIEKMAWGAWTPHKAKLGVSGCPRNCAEATIKDLGFVATDAGWEVHVGGNGGARAKVAQHLTRLNNTEEAKLFAAAFLQLYREEGRYKERSADWLERIGLDFLTKRLVEDIEGRKKLIERFLFAMECSQFDPWKEEVEKEDQSEYQPLKIVENI